MPDLKPDIRTVTLPQVLSIALMYFHKHLLCILDGYAIVYDEDGSWCSRCETDQFEIGIDEQKEKLKWDAS